MDDYSDTEESINWDSEADYQDCEGETQEPFFRKRAYIKHSFEDQIDSDLVETDVDEE